MSEVLAGLVAAVAALTGAFGVQHMVGRQTDRRRRRELIASLLGALASIEVDAREIRHEDDRAVIDYWLQEMRQLHGQAMTIGQELALMCDRETSEAIQISIAVSRNILWTADPDGPAPDDWQDTKEELDDAIETLTSRLHQRYGQ